MDGECGFRRLGSSHTQFNWNWPCGLPTAKRGIQRGHGCELLEEQFLTAQFEALEELLVFVEVVPLDVIEQLPAAIGQGNQAAAAMEILAMGPQMIREMGDSLSEQRDLDFRGARVVVAGFEISNYRLFVELCFCHGYESNFTTESFREGESEGPAKQADPTVSSRSAGQSRESLK